MEISAVMNIHEMAINETARQQTDAQAKQEKINQQTDPQESVQTKTMGDKAPLETPSTLTNTVQQQIGPQEAKISVERQVDAQALKETLQRAEGKENTQSETLEPGSLVDVIT